MRRLSIKSTLFGVAPCCIIRKRQIRNLMQICLLRLKTGGEGGIRTPGTVSGTSDFESDTIDHSDTSPFFFEVSKATYLLPLVNTFLRIFLIAPVAVHYYYCRFRARRAADYCRRAAYPLGTHAVIAFIGFDCARRFQSESLGVLGGCHVFCAPRCLFEVLFYLICSADIQHFLSVCPEYCARHPVAASVDIDDFAVLRKCVCAEYIHLCEACLFEGFGRFIHCVPVYLVGVFKCFVHSQLGERDRASHADAHIADFRFQKFLQFVRI